LIVVRKEQNKDCKAFCAFDSVIRELLSDNATRHPLLLLMCPLLAIQILRTCCSIILPDDCT